MDDNYMYPIIDYYGSEAKVLKFLVKHENVIYQKYIHQNSMCSWIWWTVFAVDIVNFARCSAFFFFEMVANAKADTRALLLKMFTFEFLTQLLLNRFVDISVDVRVECVKRAKEFLKHHPDLVTDVTGDFFWLICYLLNTTLYNTMKLH